jgi:4-hydroxyphenylpyruvate dioxygenase-like putative hemolysin
MIIFIIYQTTKNPPQTKDLDTVEFVAEQMHWEKHNDFAKKLEFRSKADPE